MLQQLQLFGAFLERSHQNQDTAAFFIEPNVERFKTFRAT
jgi:hypothetical protein